MSVLHLNLNAEDGLVVSVSSGSEGGFETGTQALKLARRLACERLAVSTLLCGCPVAATMFL